MYAVLRSLAHQQVGLLFGVYVTAGLGTQRTESECHKFSSMTSSGEGLEIPFRLPPAAHNEEDELEEVLGRRPSSSAAAGRGSSNSNNRAIGTAAEPKTAKRKGRPAGKARTPVVHGVTAAGVKITRTRYVQCAAVILRPLELSAIVFHFTILFLVCTVFRHNRQAFDCVRRAWAVVSVASAKFFHLQAKAHTHACEDIDTVPENNI